MSNSKSISSSLSKPERFDSNLSERSTSLVSSWKATVAAMALLFVMACCRSGSSLSFRSSNEGVGEIVSITPFLPNRTHEAKEAVRVKDPTVLPGVKNYAGFATVDVDKKNHLFWWYLEPTNVAPGEKFSVLVWLQGGPGASSLFGLFSEFGPYKLKADLSLERRKINWNEKHGLLFIDNPVGTGFSFSETGTFSTSAKGDVADQLYELLRQFYEVFPELKTGADLYITGESYGGHWVPGIGHKLLREKEGGSDIPFKGIAIGNAWVDPITQFTAYPDILYDLALITTTEKVKIQEICDQAVSFIKQGKYAEAFKLWDMMFSGAMTGFPNYFFNITGLRDNYNFLNTKEPAYEEYFSDYVQLDRVRKAIHVGNQPFGAQVKELKKNLEVDFMVSLKAEVEDLLAKNYKVLIYNGQLDIVIHPALTRRYIAVLNWSGHKKYFKEPQKIWRYRSDNDDVLGYVKKAEGLTVAVVRNAGHMVPSDQPLAALDLLTRWIKDEPF